MRLVDIGFAYPLPSHLAGNAPKVLKGVNLVVEPGERVEELVLGVRHHPAQVLLGADVGPVRRLDRGEPRGRHHAAVGLLEGCGDTRGVGGVAVDVGDPVLEALVDGDAQRLVAQQLLQAEAELPELIVVDEPELGLHPYALNLIASLFKKVSHHTQVLISTQSRSFLDNFDPEDVIVVNREGRESRLARLEPERLESWLEEYSLGEVWEKNVFGGGPR